MNPNNDKYSLEHEEAKYRGQYYNNYAENRMPNRESSDEAIPTQYYQNYKYNETDVARRDLNELVQDGQAKNSSKGRGLSGGPGDLNASVVRHPPQNEAKE